MSQLIVKDPDAGKDWGQEEKGTTEDEMTGWHHWLGGHKSEQTLRDNGRHRSMVRYSPWGRKELDTIKWLYNNNNIWNFMYDFKILFLRRKKWTGKSTAFPPTQEARSSKVKKTLEVEGKEVGQPVALPKTEKY